MSLWYGDCNGGYEDGDLYTFAKQCMDSITLTDKLREFHNQFDSSTRAMLRDCLFRQEKLGRKVRLQILCPNQAVQKRLLKKRQKIGNVVWSIWNANIDRIALCVDQKGLRCHVFNSVGDRIE